MTGQEAAERTAHATHADALYRDCRLCVVKASWVGLDLSLLWPSASLREQLEATRQVRDSWIRIANRAEAVAVAVLALRPKFDAAKAAVLHGVTGTCALDVDGVSESTALDIAADFITAFDAIMPLLDNLGSGS